MKEQYDPKILRKLQLAECKIFKDFIELCEKYDLPYFLFAGCAIGVERHKGFIPWDDDIDIGMLRKDYDRFLEIAKKEYSDKYRILDIKVEPKLPFYNAKFIRKGTKNVPVIFKEINIDLGIDIEIYPFDNVAPKGLKRMKQLFSVFFWHKLRILRDIEKPVLFISGWKKPVVQILCKIIHLSMKKLNISREFINRHYMKNATKYNDIRTKWVSCFFATTPLENAMRYDEIFPLKKKKFEYLIVQIPNKNHNCLTRKFGNYMVIPPVEKRKNHVPYRLEFGDFENIEIDI